MKTTVMIVLFLLPFLVVSPEAPAGGKGLAAILAERSDQFASEAGTRGGSDGPLVFRYFTESVVRALEGGGDAETAGLIRRVREQGRADSTSAGVMATLIHSYARAHYKNEIIAATSRMIRFRTYATDVPNRLNPEFISQKKYLGDLAGQLGLGFRDVDGYVQEIWIGEGGESLGLMSHSDVQPVEEKSWSGDPWSGEVTGGAIRGRGAIDDKGAIAAIMYGMRALLDSRLQINNKLILLVGTDEESANEDIATYLQANAPPARTVVVDFEYPVFCAEKGWCGVWLKASRERDVPAPGLNVVEIQSGFSPSIVPAEATAKILPVGVSPGDAERRLRALAGDFERSREGAKIEISVEDSLIVATAKGRTVHSSVPETGHNALMDLLVWLDRDVRPARNSLAAMAAFGAKYIGFELDGRSLGIAHTDSFMGDVSVAADMFSSDPDSVMFMFNFRIPKGMDLADIGKTLDLDIGKFSDSAGIRFSEQRYLSEPLYNDPGSSFVKKLLGIYNDVTGEAGTARSMGGGTYAHRIPNSVVFGPNLSGDEYLGHQPNEQISLRALTRNIEILTHTLAVFGLE